MRPAAINRKSQPLWRDKISWTPPETKLLQTIGQNRDTMENYQTACVHCQAVIVLLEKPTAASELESRIVCPQCKKLRFSGLKCMLCGKKVRLCTCSTLNPSQAQAKITRFGGLGIVKLGEEGTTKKKEKHAAACEWTRGRC